MRKSTIYTSKVTIKDIVAHLELEIKSKTELMEACKSQGIQNPSVSKMYYAAEGVKMFAENMLMAIKTNSPHYLKM